MSDISLPELPVPHQELLHYITQLPDATPLADIFKPYRQFEAQLRQLYAQDPSNTALNSPYINVLPLFSALNPQVQIRARDFDTESEEQADRYLMPLPDSERKPNGSPAVVNSIKEFQKNFNIFSESSLADLDWSNVVVSGSAVVNCLLPVPDEYNTSKRTLREYYHEKFCPASDVDLFLYGLTEEEAIEKILQIEGAVRDAILTETTTIRTKNAITICSQYPTRHVQIVLRIYKSISEILTGFDVDCSGAAYDGNQVYCTPRALQSYITQINHVDLSRRSPSYETRLSKYSKKFEVYWPELDRSRIDPTIFERNFRRTLGLARLLVLERLPTSSARDNYLAKRRAERGRPAINRRNAHRLAGNIKDLYEDEIADWVNEEEVSNYHTFTIPYGVRFQAKKIEKLCYTRDLLLNAEWNQPKDREVYLHRHPAFFGTWSDVMNDCCGFCPKPETEEEKEVFENESKIYVSGKVSFIKDDPGRQEIGSFHPLTNDDWTEMAYVGNTARLCQDIIDGELEHVQDWLTQEAADSNTRDYTGRTPLHLAVMSSTPEIVKALVDHGARLVARLADGRTALHLAAERGDVEIVKILMEKSRENEAEEEEKKSKEQIVNTSASGQVEEDDASADSDIELLDYVDPDEDSKSTTAGSFFEVKKDDTEPEEDVDDPDFYDVNVIAWDTPCSALHFAIISGHDEVVKLLVQEYGADILLPIRFTNPNNNPMAAILTLVLSVKLPLEKAMSMVKTLLSLGVTSAQADLHGTTAFQRLVEEDAYELIEILLKFDQIGTKSSINHISITSWKSMSWPLQCAIEKGDVRMVLRLLESGAMVQPDFDTWLKAAKQSCMETQLLGYEANLNIYKTEFEQPIIKALQSPNPSIALELVNHGADVNAMMLEVHKAVYYKWNNHKIGTVLDLTREQLRRLREYKPPAVPPPQLRFGMDEVVNKYKIGTWQHASVLTAANLAKMNNKQKFDHHKKEEERIEKLKGVKEKQDAIDTAVATLEQIEKVVVAKGGKTFKELHPDLYYDISHLTISQPREVSTEFEHRFLFHGVTDVTETRRLKYIELFEAAWEGDLEKIKALTLASWDHEIHDPPLHISVHDGSNGPFSLAYSRGHHEVARAILEIAQAQYTPEEKPVVKYRMQASEDPDEMDDSSDDDGPQIYREIVDEKFTIENIGQVSMLVKSRVKPLHILSQNMTYLSPEEGPVSGETCCLLKHIIKENDRKGLKYYYDLTVQFAGQNAKGEDNEGGEFVAFPQWAFYLAIEKGNTEMLRDMISWTGAGLPLEHLVKKSGVELQEKPLYYQGLSVYGKKRKDWATAGRQVVSRPRDNVTSPLMFAAQMGTIESVEWILSDAPLRHYLEFGKSKAAKEDMRLRHLNQSPGGFEKVLVKWLGAQSDLVIHAAIMNRNLDNAGSEGLVEYLIKACPSSLEAKNVNNLTPLALACWLGKINLVKILIANGADQSVKDNQWRNILHLAFENASTESQLRAFMDLLDPELQSHLFTERASIQTGDGRQPLHYWIIKHKDSFPGSPVQYKKTLRFLLNISKGEGLDNLDGEGDTPLHGLIRQGADPVLIREILQFNPQLLYRENAVGMTPLQLAHDLAVRDQLKPKARRHIWGQPDTSVANVLLNKSVYDFYQEAKGTGPYSDKGRKGGKGLLSVAQQIDDIATEFMETYPGKRRLVTLHEANDVARRLGETYRGRKNRQKKVRKYAMVSTGKRGFNSANMKDEESEESGEERGHADIVSQALPSMRYFAWVETEKVNNLS